MTERVTSQTLKGDIAMSLEQEEKKKDNKKDNKKGRQSQAKLVTAPPAKATARKSDFTNSEILEYAKECYRTGRIKNLQKFIKHLKTGKQDKSMTFYFAEGKLLYQDDYRKTIS